MNMLWWNPPKIDTSKFLRKWVYFRAKKTLSWKPCFVIWEDGRFLHLYGSRTEKYLLYSPIIPNWTGSQYPSDPTLILDINDIEVELMNLPEDEFQMYEKSK